MFETELWRFHDKYTLRPQQRTEGPERKIVPDLPIRDSQLDLGSNLLIRGPDGVGPDLLIKEEDLREFEPNILIGELERELNQTCSSGNWRES